LVEQRLEQVMVLAVEQRDRDARRIAQPLRCVQAGEAGADDDDLLHSAICCQAHSTMG
jgi:hypothetical protein